MNIKEILKINFSNSEYLMERNIDSSLEQDKNWINFINLNSIALLNYFNNLNGSINNKNDLFGYFIYKKILFILEKIR